MSTTTTTAALPCLNGSAASLPSLDNSSSIVSFQPCALPLQLPIITTTTSSIISSDQLLYLYSRFDLLLLILNVTLILLPLCKYLFLNLASRLSFMKCINKQIATWKSVSNNSSAATGGSGSTSNVAFTIHRHHKLNQIAPSSQKSFNKGSKSVYKSVTLNDNLSILETDPLTNNNNNNNTSLPAASAGNGLSKPRRSIVAPRRSSCKPPSPSTFGIHNRLGELITQTSYIFLFLFYLGYTLELTIIYFTRRKGDQLERQQQQQSYSIVPTELLTATLTLFIHLSEYGIIYGRRLWLSSSVDPEKVSKKFSSPKAYHRYSYTLHSFAFVYNAVQSVVSIAKLVITVLLLQSASAGSAVLLFQLLKPYLLTGMILLQFYFTGKHLLRLIEISLYIQNLCELQKASKENVKYRRSQSTFLSMITFTWFLDILRIGYTRNLGLGDLGTLPGVELASSQYERFYKHYRFVDITKHRRLFLWIVCWRTYKKSLIFGALIKILSDLSSLIGPISIGYILTYISNAQNSSSENGSSRSEAAANDAAILVFSEGHQMEFINAAAFFQNAYVMTIIVLISTFIQSTFSNNFNHLVISEGIHLKTALNCCIYNKALRMPITNSGIDIGIISNYMSTDSSNIFQFFTMMHYLWSVPIKIFILLYLLYQQMGVSAIVGASIFFILSPFQYYCSRKISHIQKQQMDVSDSRLSKTTELFMGIKLLKLLGWDLSFAEHIKALRGKELELLKKDAIYVAINTFLTQGSAILVTMITFSLFPLIEQRPLTAATVFTSIALFNQITTPLYIVPLVIPMLVSAIVSHRRLVDYLSIAELNTDFIQWEEGPIRQQDIAPNSAPIMAPHHQHHHKVLDRSQSVLASSISLASSTVALRSPPSAPAPPVHLCCYTKNGRFAWYDEKDEENATLSEVNIQLPRGKLTIVVGSIGCGKSTFLASLLGETKLTGGELHWQAENARGFGYVPSDPWIRNVSLRENIVFGRVFDPEWYSKVVQATCLQADIDLLPYRDQTVIGERGVNLSGGQRQRIALARAIYSSASTLILDDSLSALDPIVGYSVFDNAIVKLVVKLQRRTVILATHRQEFLSRADYVVAIESGGIRNQGTLAAIEKEDKSFFYQWNVIRDKERRERLGLKASTCKTMEERHKLVRMTTMKNEFRGPRRAVKRDPSLSRFKKRKPLKSLSRQMSCDASNALPCHDWSLGDTDDIIQESELEHSVAEETRGGHHHSSNLSRLISSESEHSKHSYLSLTSSNSAIGGVGYLSQGDLMANQGSITSNQSAQLQHCYTVPSGSSTGGGRPPFLRLHSRISNYSVTGPNSIIEEEGDDEDGGGGGGGGGRDSASSSLLCCKHNASREDCGCLSLKQTSASMISRAATTPTEETAKTVVAAEESATTAAAAGGNNSDSEHESTESEYSPVEDNTTEECKKLVDEVNNFNENQVETGTLYNVDINPQNNQIKVAVYLAYIRAHSYSLAGLVFGLIILNQAVKVVSDFWLAKWTDSDEKASYSVSSLNRTTANKLQESSTTTTTMHYYVYTYTVLSLISVLISLTTNVSAQLIAIRAVRLLHDNLIDTLVRCRLQFFDKTPIGRIMNRFTNDINVIDKKLPIAIPVLLRFFFLCLSAIIVNIIITPYFLFAIIPILVVYYYLQKVFRCTSRQLQRLELSTKAPIISHFNQTIDGLTTIRAFKEQSTFTEQFFRLLDTNNLCFLMVNSANCCLGIFLDYLGGVILFIATLISITAALYWNVQSAFVGLAMTYTLLVPVYLNWLVRNLAAVEMNMNSVERIYRYTQMDIEDSCLNKLKESDSCVPEEWPKSGDIQFIGVSIRYETNFEPIIKNASIHIRSGEKIGICGRTGSGKSSLISALFRINQICKGSILVDGQDIAAVCPYKLRKKLSIIPQDMVLFSGTVRQNLDPGKRHTDEEIWRILKDFQLDKVITSLDEEICDESQALSSGSRQLLCCVRAFLRHSPVLIMDESTSLLDATSEQLVLQQIFRSQKTIIAIAHRIINIANFDRVIVVDAGRIAEFDTPANLLQNAASIFYSLYNKASSR